MQYIVIFQLFEDTFLAYFKSWKSSIDNRPAPAGRGYYTKTEKAQMFISHQTYKGLVTTCKSN